MHAFRRALGTLRKAADSPAQPGYSGVPGSMETIMQDRIKVCGKRIACRGSLLLLAFLFAFSFTPTRAQTCTISNILVNSCGPWLGAYADNYPGISEYAWVQQLQGHEKRVGYNMGLAHDYSTASALTSDEINVANGNSGLANYLVTDWNPTSEASGYTWADAEGCSVNNTQNCATVDTDIKSMADSILQNVQEVSGNKMFIALSVEPQHWVSSDPGSKCSAYINKKTGYAGTPQNYVAMWQNVRNIFKQEGVTNVVWVLIYQSDQSFECFLPELYPGAANVDWIGTDVYDEGPTNNPSGWHTAGALPKNGTGIGDLAYTQLSELPGANAKPFMVAEFGSQDNYGDNENKAFYSQIGAGVDQGTFPKIHAYLAFDAICVQVDYANPVGDTCPSDESNLMEDGTKQKSYKKSIVSDSNFQKLSQ